MNVDLRSDTLTKPTAGMLEAMMQAKSGDDVFGEDPTVNQLEAKAAELFGMEDAIFCASGTMTNQIAIKVHTQPGDEVICDRMSHIYNYEGGGIAFNSGASVRLIQGDRGRITAKDILANINADNVHYPVSSLVELENTVNRGGGSYYDFEEIRKIVQLCKNHQLALHLDGARLFNALAETQESPKDFGQVFDTISICLSKGLGAPVGSLLLGSKSQIIKARRIRKVFGGGWRQAGFLAAAGIYALDHHVDRLRIDHQNARHIGKQISKLPFVNQIDPVDTNIVIFSVEQNIEAGKIVDLLASKNILVLHIGSNRIRMVTHLDITESMMDYLTDILPGIY